jgi:hypothetical protein
MSRKTSIPLLEKFSHRLRPFWLFSGIAIGLSFMVIAGHWAGKQNPYFGFQRHHRLISPESFYYPSLDNLTALVRHSTSKKQILVIVGGSSVLIGESQKEKEIWTAELQRLLGPDFKVINLAFRSAEWTEMGAVVAEVLSKEFPRIIYVADQVPMNTYPIVPETYAYLFWQAQASGKLLKFQPRSDKLKETILFAKDPQLRGRMTEEALRGFIDYWTHASDFWNYVGYNYFFTVKNSLATNKRFFEPRKNYVDRTEDVLPIAERFKEMNEQRVQIVRGLGSNSVQRDTKGQLRLRPGLIDVFLSYQQNALPNVLKAKTLIILTYMAWHYSHQLSADEYAAYEFVFSQGKHWLEQAGYHSVIVGPNLTDEDYSDLLHLAASGGQKMAQEVAPEIRSMAFQLGYLSTSPEEGGP